MRIGLSFVLLGLAVLNFAPKFGAQTTAPSAPESQPALDPSHDEAAALLKKASEAQCASANAPEIFSLEANFQFVAFEYDDRGKSSAKPGDIRQYWASKKSPKGETKVAYRRELKADVGEFGTQTVAFDDVAWKLDPKGTKQISMMTKEYESSREKLRLERRRSTQMIRLFFLGRLDPKNPALKVVEKKKKIDFEIGEGEFHHEATVIETTDDDKNVLRLAIDDKTNYVVRAEIVWAGGKTADVYHFARHQKKSIDHSDAVAVLPAWIQYVEGGRPSVEITANNMNGLKLNAMTPAEMKRLFEFDDE